LVDLHAITIRQDTAQLRKWKNESFAMLLAVGLDPKRSIIFHQSAVPAHAELMWILSCQASTGYLSRMTQWKEKAAGERENSEKLKLGLFSYPVLQAADVLVHRATHVPVGHDQAQHLEFAREVANGFNHIYGEGILVPPDTLISPAKRIMSLTDAKLKMSKSHANPKSRILLTDSEEEIRSKIKTAITDSGDNIKYDPEGRPGISNLLEIFYYTSPKGQYNSIEDIVCELDGLGFRIFKELVAANVEATVRPIRERYSEFVGKEDYLAGVALAGAEKAAKSAESTLRSVKEAVGLL
jgi:tryptophanyl-tRNA synthetase